MVELSKIKIGQRVADLGSGDGRISIEFGKAGALVEGFELDEKLLNSSVKTINENGLSNNIKVYKKNFWDINLSIYDIIIIYPMPDIMLSLEKKLNNELKQGTKIITNYYTFPNWKYETMRNNIYLYIKN